MRRKAPEAVEEEKSATGYMPARFVSNYLSLVNKGLKVDPSAQVFDNVNTKFIKKRFHQHDGGLKNEAALRVKTLVDRRLRGLSVEIESFLAGGSMPKPPLACLGCGQYVSAGWRFCASCGRKLNEETSTDDNAGGDGR
jgi:hypothetical protein